MKSCECYDVVKKEWRATAPMNESKTNTSVGTFDDKYIYVFGGYNKGLYDLATIEKLNATKKNKWVVVELASKSNWGPTQNMGVMQISKNEILIWGGMRNGKMLNTSVIFKVKERTVEKAADMMDSDTFLQVSF